MLGTLNLPLAPAETDRYEPCPQHAAALDRMVYDRAWDVARRCPWCITEARTSEDPRAGGPDRCSSVSRQHFIDTGRYLTCDEVEQLDDEEAA